MLREIKLTMNKTQAEINREWDVIVPARDAQQRSGDVSFLRVLRPWIGSAVRDARCILDVGCGSGRLTQTLRAGGARVVGVDPSPRSIALAQSSDPVGIYHAGTLEQFAAENQQERFDLAVANMVLMDAPDLDGLLAGIARLASGGRFVATLAHPAFWPLYLGYAGNDAFSYGKEVFVEAPYVVNNQRFQSATTHIHRPVSRYISAFAQAGMTITRMEELRGTEPRSAFPFPRFLAIEAKITRSEESLQ